MLSIPFEQITSFHVASLHSAGKICVPSEWENIRYGNRESSPMTLYDLERDFTTYLSLSLGNQSQDLREFSYNTGDHRNNPIKYKSFIGTTSFVTTSSWECIVRYEFRLSFMPKLCRHSTDRVIISKVKSWK